MPTLRSGQSVAILTFRNVSFNFSTAISKFDTFSSYHIVCTQIAKVTASFSLFALSELVCTKKVPYPIHYSSYLFTPSLFSFEALRTDSLSSPFTHHLFPKFFYFPLSAWGPTRRRNSTGRAELWGGWPIELAGCVATRKNNVYCPM